jgi:hypothetical protein
MLCTQVQVMFRENIVLYRESGETEPDFCYDTRYQNIALKQPTMLGPWLVMSLGTVLVCFLIYLVYSNLLVPVQPKSLSERWLHLTTDTITGVPESDPWSLLQFRPLGTAITAVPHSRAANALLGGQGPALPPGSETVAPRGAMEAPISVAVVPR